MKKIESLKKVTNAKIAAQALAKELRDSGWSYRQIGALKRPNATLHQQYQGGIRLVLHGEILRPIKFIERATKALNK